jgi:hypothetical protein
MDGDLCRKVDLRQAGFAARNDSRVDSPADGESRLLQFFTAERVGRKRDALASLEMTISFNFARCVWCLRWVGRADVVMFLTYTDLLSYLVRHKLVSNALI